MLKQFYFEDRFQINRCFLFVCLPKIICSNFFRKEINIQNLKLTSLKLRGPAIVATFLWERKPLLLHKCDAFPSSCWLTLNVLASSHFCVNTTTLQVNNFAKDGSCISQEHSAMYRSELELKKRNLQHNIWKDEVSRLHCSWGLITARRHVEVPVGSSYSCSPLQHSQLIF